MSKRLGTSITLAAVILVVVTAAAGAQTAGQKFVVYGADTSQAERQELAQFFGIGADARTDVVTTAEMVQALGGTGLQVAPTDRSISSSALTCLNRGDGLSVRTQNITRIPAAVYANALVTAGVGDGGVLIAAPAANPVTGETALAGVLKAFPQCQAGRQPDAARLRLAYGQVARTVQLAGSNADSAAINRASTALLAAAQSVITGQARDDAAINAALDQATAANGVQASAAQRADLIDFLRQLGAVDYGTYARGYQVQQVSPTEVRVIPAGAGAPGATQAPAQAGQATVQVGAAANPAAETFAGEVRAAGDTLTVRTDAGERQVGAAPGLVVTRDGDPAALGDIEEGDDVRVTVGPDGRAQRIDAPSEDDGAGLLRWLIPLLLALLALAALLWFLLGRRKKDDFILQPKGGTTGGATAGSGDDFIVERGNSETGRR